MNIAANNLYSEMQSMSLQATKFEADPTALKAPTTTSASFGDMLQQAIDNVSGLQQNTGDLRTRFDQGARSVSLSDVMIASQKSGIAFDATVQVRNKLIESYKEIMSMPV